MKHQMIIYAHAYTVKYDPQEEALNFLGKVKDIFSKFISCMWYGNN